MREVLELVLVTIFARIAADVVLGLRVAGLVEG
jgi:hypothetical protein